MMNRAFRFALASAFVALGACKDDEPAAPGTAPASYAAAKALWEATRPVRYTFVATRACECGPDAAGPVRIEVNGGAIVSVRRVGDNASVDPASWFDVNGLFDLINTELAQRPLRLEADYDALNGHPTHVAYGEREVDNGAVLTVSEFVALIGGTSGYLRR